MLEQCAGHRRNVLRRKPWIAVGHGSRVRTVQNESDSMTLRMGNLSENDVNLSVADVWYGGAVFICTVYRA